MNRPMTLNVRISGVLSDFVTAHVGVDGAYENVSEYVRDLIRRDKERSEAETYARLKAELVQAFAEPEGSFVAIAADDVIARNNRV